MADDPCSSQPGSCGANATGPGVCGPGEANAPLASPGTLALSLQPPVDAARRIVHALGLRGYRVFLVWTRRNSNQRYVELRRVELMPVLVTGVGGVAWEGSPSGMQPQGDVALAEVSPAQVTADELFGRAVNFEWHLDPDIDFFYEIAVSPRCAGDRPQVGRFTPATLPFYDIENFQWTITLASQFVSGDPTDTADGDPTFQPVRDTQRAQHGRKKSTLRT